LQCRPFLGLWLADNSAIGTRLGDELKSASERCQVAEEEVGGRGPCLLEQVTAGLPSQSDSKLVGAGGKGWGLFGARTALSMVVLHYDGIDLQVISEVFVDGWSIDELDALKRATA
jgi:hypothetical protein